MTELLLQPTTTAQWHALINEAQASSNLTLPEEIESYLVFLLMRFTGQPDMAHSILGLDFLESLNHSGEKRHLSLRDVGDKCLLFAGLFPGRAQRRRVNISYFVDIGQSAYASIANLHKDDLTILFQSLCSEFVPLMDVLLATRDLAGQHSSLDLMQACELWQDTKSQQAYTTISNNTTSPPALDIPLNNIKRKSH